MPRYHFHTEDGECLADKEGTELKDIDAARDTSVQLLAECLKGNSELFWRHEGFAVIVTDHSGLRLFQLHLGVVESPVAKRH